MEGYVNFLEVLFSREIVVNPGISDRNKELLDELFSRSEAIARMHLPYLYNACIGMFYNKKKDRKKGTAGTQHLVDKFGYDTKQAMHSLRILDFLVEQ